MKKTKIFKDTDTSDDINKGYLDEKIFKRKGNISYIEKDYIDFNLQYNKQSVEEVLVQRTVKTTIEILYGKGLFDNYAIGENVIEDFLFVTRSRDNLSEQVNDDIQ